MRHGDRVHVLRIDSETGATSLVPAHYLGRNPSASDPATADYVRIQLRDHRIPSAEHTVPPDRLHETEEDAGFNRGRRDEERGGIGTFVSGPPDYVRGYLAGRQAVRC